MNARFAPGPWAMKVEPQRYPECDDADLPAFVRDATGRVIVVVNEEYRHGDYEADAHLIAAAPDLYEAAEQARLLIGEAGQKDELSEAARQSNRNQAWHLLNLALRKARGEA